MIGRAVPSTHSKPPVRLKSQLEKGQLLEPTETGEISSDGGVRNDEFCHCMPPWIATRRYKHKVRSRTGCQASGPRFERLRPELQASLNEGVVDGSKTGFDPTAWA